MYVMHLLGTFTYATSGDPHNWSVVTRNSRVLKTSTLNGLWLSSCSFNKYLLRAYRGPAIVLGTGDLIGNLVAGPTGLHLINPIIS